MPKPEKLGDILRDALQQSPTAPPVEDVRALFPLCKRCGEPCTDELSTVLASERPYRVAHFECEQRHHATPLTLEEAARRIRDYGSRGAA